MIPNNSFSLKTARDTGDTYFLRFDFLALRYRRTFPESARGGGMGPCGKTLIPPGLPLAPGGKDPTSARGLGAGQ